MFKRQSCAPSFFCLALFLVSPLRAGEPIVRRDLPYTEPKSDRQRLDIYAPAEGKNHPIAFWIHGGGWRRGDKANVRNKSRAFVDKGFVFVSANYRFVPEVTVKEMAGDIAKAIRWVHEHAKDFGGDPKSIFVMGHSAGAHLSALVCTDDRYLKAEGLPLSIIKGCVPVDVGVYDIPKRFNNSDPPLLPRLRMLYENAFGKSAEAHKEMSPVTHVAKGKNIPPFLILHVADRRVTKEQSHWLADKLKEAGVPARVVAAKGTTHGTINANLGLAKDRPTQEVFQFMNEVLETK